MSRFAAFIALVFAWTIHAQQELPAIWIAGDSTAARGAGEAQQGWGEPFKDYFDAAKAKVVNRARGGRSSRTFLSEGLWDGLMQEVKKGDIVLIQFGHNDGGAFDRPPFRGSLPGLGEETREATKTNGTVETVHTFGWYLRKYIADTKAKGAVPIVMSLTVRNEWPGGKVERGSGRFGKWSYEVAKTEKVLFLDATTLVADEFDKLGPQTVKEFYPKDHTHFTVAGADFHARWIVAGLKGLRPSPIAKFLSEKGEAIVADRFSWLRLPVPANRNLPTIFLIGDSTVRNGRGDGINGQWGWGDYLEKSFDAGKINIVNQAVGGLSSRTYLTQGHWERVLGMMKPGDFVLMQFGHNDNGSPTNPPPGRTAIKGVGEETLQSGDETVHTFGWYLRRYIADTKGKGATPMVCSLVPRKTWKDGKIVRNKNAHAGWAETVATAEGVGFLDLNEKIAARYDELGSEKVEPLFADEHTHTSAAGAEFNAETVAQALSALSVNPLAKFMRQ